MDFREALQKAIKESPKRIRWIDRIKARWILRHPEALTDVELEAIELGIKCGLLKPESIAADGSPNVADWGDGVFWQTIVDSLPQILEFISGLVKIFMLFAVLAWMAFGLFAV